MDSETQPWGIQVERRRAACRWRCIRHDYHMQLDRISRSVTEYSVTTLMPLPASAKKGVAVVVRHTGGVAD